ncbi:MAG: primary-amine oxidase [Tepidiformaceae bacterium]
MVSIEKAPTTVLHPLEPLTGEEIRAAAAIVRGSGRLGERTLFASISLAEPPKDEVRAFQPGAGGQRRAVVVVLDRNERAAYEVLVNLAHEKVETWERAEGQPGMSMDELLEVDAAVKADSQYQAALANRGITDLDLVMIDPWPQGNFGEADEKGQRLARALSWLRTSPTDNGYARPIEGVIAIVDLHAMKVWRLEDHGVLPLPPNDGNYTAAAAAPLRTDIKPLHITQPEGPSFSIEGHLVKWQKWQVRFGFTHREGLVLHQVGYEDGGRLRSVLNRASLSEMVVPYGDPGPMHYRKNAFDAGEYGIGMCTNSLELGCDCVGEIRYFDGVIADGAGEPVTITNAICLHEEDYGMLWKHTDSAAGVTEVRRSRRLVLSSVATVGNYEYGFFWYFYQDGSIEYEIKLTGVVSTGAIAQGETRKYGTVIAPGLYAPIHQHFFSIRLDMAIDGERNSVYELNTEAEPAGPANPYGNAFFVRPTLLAREAQAQRLINPLTARSWKFTNPNVRNGLGEPVAYRLMPGEQAVPFNLPGSSLIKRAGFVTRHLWVTPYADGERHAAGQYPNQHAGGAGLPAWTAANREIEDTDIVAWYTMGHHHVVRPEDWPVMPTYYVGFKLLPIGFFDRNPSLDVPPSPKGDACHD